MRILPKNMKYKLLANYSMKSTLYFPSFKNLMKARVNTKYWIAKNCKALSLNTLKKGAPNMFKRDHYQK